MANVIFELPISYWLAHSFFIPFHEFGHARAYAANGGKYRYGSSFFENNIKASSYWELSFTRLLTPPFGFPGSGDAWTQWQDYKYDKLSPDIQLVVSICKRIE